ncbi:hypothetical protein STEG23_032991 [Scotinomys teguina]
MDESVRHSLGHREKQLIEFPKARYKWNKDFNRKSNALHPIEENMGNILKCIGAGNVSEQITDRVILYPSVVFDAAED